MTAWNGAPMNWRKLTVEPHKQMRRCHDRNVHGNLRPIEEDKAPWWMVATFIVAGAYGLAIWL